MSQKVIGVLGGMGPAATSELFHRIVTNTAAEMDQEHVNMVIVNDPQIPDRTAYILGEGISPVPKLVDNLYKLYNAGANVAIMPCMTAHSLINELEKNSPIPIINAVELVEKHLQINYPYVEKIGLLATNGSVASGVFQKYISTELVVPNIDQQQDLMQIIYGKDGIKAGNTGQEITSEIKNITNQLKDQNIQGVIAGCTELGLVMNEDNTHMPVIDPIMLLAKEAVRIGNNYSVTIK
ncbi:amino acid racemase [Virgibacillus sp. NKC19-16]|uniref:aspartate/glutamate racemase family protein n=1 Tax=Virgibacillus salidurans TaxID=2831673 RepID=UPI001F44E447|nr:amino acid racemase [Virgibacillus sp. NKC19-16]UJL45905.1 amino acid racemase [Virgibacillus sp. NKC19-16]